MPHFGIDSDRYGGWTPEEKEEALESAEIPADRVLREDVDRIGDLLSQDACHKIVQMILGHPSHLASLDELTYMTGKDRDAVQKQLDALEEADLIDVYQWSENRDSEDYPTEFWGFTEHGVRILEEYEYLSGAPAMRALYDKTKKDSKIREHEAAPRPDLPSVVATALSPED